METKFSVCMCVYHADNPVFVKEAINSVFFNQTVRPSEIIIVVDGQIDNNLNNLIIFYENQKEFFKVIRLQKNEGHAIARQKASNASSNDIIAIMDADDISVYNRFELQLKVLEKNPDISVVGGQIKEFIGSIDHVVGERVVPLQDCDIKKYLKGRCPMNLVTVMYRKQDVDSAGGFLDWYCEEDYYLWIRMFLNGLKFQNVPESLVNVRVGSEMYRRRGGWKYFRSEAKLQRFMLIHKIISFPRYLFNVIVRFIIQVATPNWLRSFIFQKLFRK